MKHWILALSLLFALSAGSFGQAPKAKKGNLRYQIERFAADENSLVRFYSTQLSTNVLGRITDFYQTRREELLGHDFSEMERSAQVDWLLLRNYIDQKLAEKVWRLQDLKADLPYLPFIEQVVELDRWRNQLTPFTPQEGAEKLSAIREEIKAGRKAVEDVRKEAEKARKKAKEEATESESKGDAEAEENPNKEGKEAAEATEETADSENAEDEEYDETVEPSASQPFPTWRVYRMIDRINACKRQLDAWYNHYAKFSPGFEWWVKASFEETKKQMNEYEKWLREKVSGVKDRNNGPLFGERVGAERLESLIRFEMIPYSVDELLDIAQKEFDWCVAEMDKAAKELGMKDRKAALEFVKDQFVPAGKQGEYVAQVAREATEFVVDRKLVTVPPLARETWRIKMVDEKQQRTLPYAAYSGQNVLVAFATGPMDQEKKLMSMRGNNLHSTRLVTAHEVIPGHHLQLFMGDRFRQDRKKFRTPFFIEGWALHWEMKLWDEGFARGPEDRIGMLFWRMHRCARVLVTLKFHRDQMEPDEMVKFLTDQIGHGKDQATAEVRRYIASSYSALYQAAYMIGGKQLRSLHKTMMEKGMSEQAFHDRILRLGPIPLEMMRAELLEDIPLSKDWKTNWRF